MKKMYIIKSTFKDIYKNLAYENYLFNLSEKENCAILFLWENNSTVVIGKHQNPYKECNLEYIKENKIKLSRRITGGGAVFHTNGNINFSFITPIKYKNSTENIIQNSLLNLKIKVEKTGRNDLVINNKKISGNAYYKSKNTYLHHGTILISMDYNHLGKILTPNISKLSKNSVKSVESRVGNLSEFCEKIKKSKVFKEIGKEFVKEFSKDFELKKEKIVINNEDFKDLYKKFKSKKWIFGNFKNYTKIEKIESLLGSIEILKNCENKYIISTDIVEANVLSEFENLEMNNSINKENILKILKNVK